MPIRRWIVIVAVALSASACRTNVRTAAVARPTRPLAAAPAAKPVPAPDPAAIRAPEGYRVEAVLTDLVYPSSIEVDEAGNLYVAESGYVYGDPHAPARLLRLSPEGELETITDALVGPVNDLLWADGRLFISHRGKVSVLEQDGGLRDIVTGLPSFGDHHNNQLAMGSDGKLYMGQGTATNSGVVGVDNFLFGWLALHPDQHDRSPYPLKLRGEGFATLNPFVLGGAESAPTRTTGAFAAFGDERDEVDPTAVKANGTILRFNPDGSELEVYAWGLRNPFGLEWGADGRLYCAENGFDERGSRPIANDTDDLYAIEQGAWYGWPDFAGGEPVTDPRFRPEDGPEPEMLLEDHPPVEKPLMTFPTHTGVAKLAVDRTGTFGARGALFLAAWGPLTPLSGPAEAEAPRPAVLRLDPVAKRHEVFLEAAPSANGEAGGEPAGLRRPIDVVFTPNGKALYVVDQGVFEVLATRVPMPRPRPGTGVVWRVVPEGAQVAPRAGISAGPGGAPRERALPAGLRRDR